MCPLGLRTYYLGTLSFLGKYTLETYLLQHHVWMTSNAKSLLARAPKQKQGRTKRALLSSGLGFGAGRWRCAGGGGVGPRIKEHA